jgi:bis(5'-nucleosyl)-tetraphosphatase (symmetrical)
MATFVVGDIQGCLKPLQALLETVNFNQHNDLLISAGDLINRGPES